MDASTHTMGWVFFFSRAYAGSFGWEGGVIRNRSLGPWALDLWFSHRGHTYTHITLGTSKFTSCHLALLSWEREKNNLQV